MNLVLRSAGTGRNGMDIQGRLTSEACTIQPRRRAMASTTTSVISGIITRIEWCRKQRTKARTQPELEGWRAEEEGLRDAILDREHTNQYRYSPPAVSERYAIGLE